MRLARPFASLRICQPARWCWVSLWVSSRRHGGSSRLVLRPGSCSYRWLWSLWEGADD